MLQSIKIIKKLLKIRYIAIVYKWEN